MLRRISLFLFAVSLYAQDDLAQAAKNPYELARYLDSHATIAWDQVWKALGVATAPPALNCGPDSRFRCSVDTITLLHPPQAVLVVQGAPANLFLRFLQDGNQWRYSGSYENVKKNFGYRYEISRLFDQSFLRVASQGANGSNWDSEVEVWFDLSQATFEPVFSFTAQGSENRMGLGVSHSVRAVAEPESPGPPETIRVDAEIHYSGFTIDLGYAEYVVTYTRAANRRRFSIQKIEPLPGAPAISGRQFALLADIDVDSQLTNEQLLVYTLPRLTEIASGSDAGAKDWLRSILSFAKDIPEKRQLQSLLDR